MKDIEANQLFRLSFFLFLCDFDLSCQILKIVFFIKNVYIVLSY